MGFYYKVAEITQMNMMFPFYIQKLKNLPVLEQTKNIAIWSLTHGGHVLAHPPNPVMFSNS